MEQFAKAIMVVCCVPIILLSVIIFLDLMVIPKALNRIADALEKKEVAVEKKQVARKPYVAPVANVVPGLHWLDNADSWLCPICLMEVNTPTQYGYKCPRCGFMDEKDIGKEKNNG